MKYNNYIIQNTSEWTLDYPPFFAWFEYGLSQFAPLFDKNMLNVKDINYISDNTIIFQRLTVIISEFLLFFGCLLFCKKIFNNNSKTLIITGFIILNPSILMIDHIHFQYNGFLLGILLLSITFIVSEHDLLGALMFCILICFKHIYAYIVPVYIVYLLQHYCKSDTITKSLFKLIKLGVLCISVALICFIPFLYNNPVDNLNQIISRLFPFKRGLNHTYWAANFWSLYIVFDKVLFILLKKICKIFDYDCSSFDV